MHQKNRDDKKNLLAQLANNQYGDLKHAYDKTISIPKLKSKRSVESLVDQYKKNLHRYKVVPDKNNRITIEQYDFLLNLGYEGEKISGWTKKHAEKEIKKIEEIVKAIFVILISRIVN